MRLTVTGAKEFAAFLSKAPRELEKQVERVLKQEARELAVELCRNTLPKGLEESSTTKLQKRIEGDVRRVYASRQNAGQIYRLIEQRAPQLAAAFWRAFKEGKQAQVRRYLSQAGLSVDLLNPSLHKSARGSNGAVPKTYLPQQLVRESEVRSFARKQSQRAGIAKAGWYAAARALGGRVRRNLVDGATGKRSTEEKVPAVIRKIARRFSNLGGANLSKGKAVIFSNVRYASEALPESLLSAAVSKSRENLRRALQAEVAAIGRSRRGAPSIRTAA